MIKNVWLCTIITFFMSIKIHAQLDKTHYLQPLVFTDYNAITEEFVYLSTPSADPIDIKVTFPNEITSPYFKINSGTTVVSNGIVRISNSNPTMLTFVNSAGTTLATGNSPIMLNSSFAGTIISANSGGLLLRFFCKL